jgi:hypothetical protein
MPAADHAICILALTGCGVAIMGLAAHVVAAHGARVKDLRDEIHDDKTADDRIADALEALASIHGAKTETKP